MALKIGKDTDYEDYERLLHSIRKVSVTPRPPAKKVKAPTAAQRCAKMEKTLEDMMDIIEAQDARIDDLERRSITKKRGKK